MSASTLFPRRVNPEAQRVRYLRPVAPPPIQLPDPLRRLAKKAKKERQGKGGGGSAAEGKGSVGAAATPGRKGKKKGPKPKMTKEERRAKYTQK